MLEILTLFIKTLVLRPYVFGFLAVAVISARRLFGWKRTLQFFGITWLTAFVCEFSSTRIGIPFGTYFYTGSTVGQELYIANIPFMDSLSFTFLLFASYCLTLLFILPWNSSGVSPHYGFVSKEALSWPVVGLTAVLFMCIDIVIDPVALRGDRWFLGQIYGYQEEGVYFGVPLTNFIGWWVVGALSMIGFRVCCYGRSSPDPFPQIFSGESLLFGCGLYYGVLMFNLAVTFWIGEWLLGVVGIIIFLPFTLLAVLKIMHWLPVQAGPQADFGH